MLFAVSQNNLSVILALQKLGDVITLGNSPTINSQSAQSHADMRICVIGEKTFCDSESLKITLRNAGVNATAASIAPKGFYPTDISLNALIINNIVFGRTDKLTPELLSSDKTVFVKQGYTHCSCAVVSDNAVITQDMGICKALNENGIDTLKINSGNIILDGCDTGFIGGCSGKLDESTLMFTGRLSSHPDGEKIKSFCATHGVHILELTSNSLIDIGGIVRLK